MLDGDGRPVGVGVPPREAVAPPPEALVGRFVQVVPLDPARHGDDLWESLVLADPGDLWTYLPTGPFTDRGAFDAWLAGMAADAGQVAHALIVAGRAVGLAAYLRVDPPARTIEVGWLAFGPQLRQTRAATEAMHLMMARAFALGFRRYEWKCDLLNAASRRAGERLGFSFEGVFRAARTVKGRNRDTAWFAVTEEEWPAIRSATEQWLADENFVTGRQRMSLSSLTAPLLVSRFPEVRVELAERPDTAPTGRPSTASSRGPDSAAAPRPDTTAPQRPEPAPVVRPGAAAGTA